MAEKVTGQVAGGSPKVCDNVNTVSDVRKVMRLGDNYSASVNGEPEDDDFELDDFSFVSFAPNVKGGIS